MDLGELGFVGVIVVAVVGAFKDQFPLMTGNQTRLVALLTGSILGILGQFGLLPGIELNVVTGIMAAMAAVGTMTAIDRVKETQIGV